MHVLRGSSPMLTNGQHSFRPSDRTFAPVSRRVHAFRLTRTPRRLDVRVLAEEEPSRAGIAAPDPFLSAAIRLQNLLLGAGDGEEELYDSMLEAEGPMNKLRITAVLGAMITGTAFVVCWLCGKDPWGGASLSLHSLQCAALGALAALPLAGFRVYSWTPEAHKQLPALEDVHRHMIDSNEPWLTGLQPSHVLGLVALETLPLLFLQLPAAQAGLNASFEWYNKLMQQVLGSGLPASVGVVVALLVTATCAGLVKSAGLMADDEELEVVSNAVQNADRYYRLMAMNKDSSSADAERAAFAFKAVALSWVYSKEAASSLAAAIQFVDVLYLGALWYATHDLTTAAVALLLTYGVDYHFMMRGLQMKSQGSQGSGQGSSG